MQKHLFWLLLVTSCTYDFADAGRCTNGELDEGEVGIDCGGSCAPVRCGFGQPCRPTEPCADGFRCEPENEGICSPVRHTGSWTQLPTPESMEGRLGATLAFGPDQGLLFGGWNRPANASGSCFESTPLRDAWEFFPLGLQNGRVWSEAEGASENEIGPPPRHYHGTAFQLERVLVAGGVGPRGTRLDVWARSFVAPAWKALAPMPERRQRFAMAADDRGRVVVYGGATSLEMDTRTDRLLVFENERWTTVTTNQGPVFRVNGAMVYDLRRRVFVHFGGSNTTTPDEGSAETWSLDLDRPEPWQRIETPHAPPQRWGHGMAYDHHREVVVVSNGKFGASDPQPHETSDLWEYDGVDWYPVAVAASPKTNLAPMGYDAVGRRMILVEGALPGYCTGTPITWSYVPTDVPCRQDLDPPCGFGSQCVNGTCVASP